MPGTGKTRLLDEVRNVVENFAVFREAFGESFEVAITFNSYSPFDLEERSRPAEHAICLRILNLFYAPTSPFPDFCKSYTSDMPNLKLPQVFESIFEAQCRAGVINQATKSMYVVVVDEFQCVFNDGDKEYFKNLFQALGALVANSGNRRYAVIVMFAGTRSLKFDVAARESTFPYRRIPVSLLSLDSVASIADHILGTTAWRTSRELRIALCKAGGHPRTTVNMLNKLRGALSTHITHEIISQHEPLFANVLSDSFPSISSRLVRKLVVDAVTQREVDPAARVVEEEPDTYESLSASGAFLMTGTLRNASVSITPSLLLPRHADVPLLSIALKFVNSLNESRWYGYETLGNLFIALRLEVLNELGSPFAISDLFPGAQFGTSVEWSSHRFQPRSVQATALQVSLRHVLNQDLLRPDEVALCTESETAIDSLCWLPHSTGTGRSLLAVQYETGTSSVSLGAVEEGILGLIKKLSPGIDVIPVVMTPLTLTDNTAIGDHSVVIEGRNAKSFWGDWGSFVLRVTDLNPNVMSPGEIGERLPSDLFLRADGSLRTACASLIASVTKYDAPLLNSASAERALVGMANSLRGLPTEQQLKVALGKAEFEADKKEAIAKRLHSLSTHGDLQNKWWY
eukprot:Opistho-2@91771